MPKKFQTFKCSVCKREVDKPFTPSYANINKCDITLNCTGKLQYVGEKNVGNLNAALVPGVVNWKQRNTKSFTTVETKALKFKPISSSKKYTFTLAVDKELTMVDPLDPSSEIYDKIEITFIKSINVTQLSTEYAFRFSEAQQAGTELSGDDSNYPSKTLVVNEDIHDVYVYLNGVPQLQQFEGGSGDYIVGLNKITMTKVIPEFSTIHVTTKDRATEQECVLTFVNNQSLQGTVVGGWQNINTAKVVTNQIDGSLVNINAVLYTLEDPNALGFDVRLQAKFQNNDSSITFKKTGTSLNKTISLSHMHYSSAAAANIQNGDSILFLLSERGFTIKDRIYTSFAKLGSVKGSSGFLKYVKYKNNYEWHVTENLLEQSKMPIEIKAFTIIDGKTQYDDLVLSTTTPDDQLNLDSSKILGL